MNRDFQSAFELYVEGNDTSERPRTRSTSSLPPFKEQGSTKSGTDMVSRNRSSKSGGYHKSRSFSTLNLRKRIHRNNSLQRKSVGHKSSNTSFIIRPHVIDGKSNEIGRKQSVRESCGIVGESPKRNEWNNSVTESKTSDSVDCMATKVPKHDVVSLGRDEAVGTVGSCASANHLSQHSRLVVKITQKKFCQLKCIDIEPQTVDAEEKQVVMNNSSDRWLRTIRSRTDVDTKLVRNQSSKDRVIDKSWSFSPGRRTAQSKILKSKPTKAGDGKQSESLKKSESKEETASSETVTETSSQLEQRPRRNIVPKKVNDTSGLSWKEETDLKKALYASLQKQRSNKVESGTRGVAGFERPEKLSPVNEVVQRQTLDSKTLKSEHQRTAKSTAGWSDPIGASKRNCNSVESNDRLLTRSGSAFQPDSSIQTNCKLSTRSSSSSLQADCSNLWTNRSFDCLAGSCSKTDLLYAALASDKRIESPNQVRAQRKFAHSSRPGTPTLALRRKVNQTSLRKDCKSKTVATEDFLTFLCLRGTDRLPPHLDLFNYSESESLQSFPNTPHESPDISQPDTPSPDPPSLPFLEPGPSSAFVSKQHSDVRKLPQASHSLRVVSAVPSLSSAISGRHSQLVGSCLPSVSLGSVLPCSSSSSSNSSSSSCSSVIDGAFAESSDALKMTENVINDGSRLSRMEPSVMMTRQRTAALLKTKPKNPTAAGAKNSWKGQKCSQDGSLLGRQGQTDHKYSKPLTTSAALHLCRSSLRLKNTLAASSQQELNNRSKVINLFKAGDKGAKKTLADFKSLSQSTLETVKTCDVVSCNLVQNEQELISAFDFKIVDNDNLDDSKVDDCYSNDSALTDESINGASATLQPLESESPMITRDVSVSENLEDVETDDENDGDAQQMAPTTEEVDTADAVNETMLMSNNSVSCQLSESVKDMSASSAVVQTSSLPRCSSLVQGAGSLACTGEMPLLTLVRNDECSAFLSPQSMVSSLSAPPLSCISFVPAPNSGLDLVQDAVCSSLYLSSSSSYLVKTNAFVYLKHSNSVEMSQLRTGLQMAPTTHHGLLSLSAATQSLHDVVTLSPPADTPQGVVAMPAINPARGVTVLFSSHMPLDTVNMPPTQCPSGLITLSSANPLMGIVTLSSNQATHNVAANMPPFVHIPALPTLVTLSPRPAPDGLVTVVPNLILPSFSNLNFPTSLAESNRSSLCVAVKKVDSFQAPYFSSSSQALRPEAPSSAIVCLMSNAVDSIASSPVRIRSVRPTMSDCLKSCLIGSSSTGVPKNSTVALSQTKLAKSRTRPSSFRNDTGAAQLKTLLPFHSLVNQVTGNPRDTEKIRKVTGIESKVNTDRKKVDMSSLRLGNSTADPGLSKSLDSRSQRLSGDHQSTSTGKNCVPNSIRNVASCEKESLQILPSSEQGASFLDGSENRSRPTTRSRTAALMQKQLTIARMWDDSDVPEEAKEESRDKMATDEDVFKKQLGCSSTSSSVSGSQQKHLNSALTDRPAKASQKQNWISGKSAKQPSHSGSLFRRLTRKRCSSNGQGVDEAESGPASEQEQRSLTPKTKRRKITGCKNHSWKKLRQLRSMSSPPPSSCKQGSESSKEASNLTQSSKEALSEIQSSNDALSEIQISKDALSEIQSFKGASNEIHNCTESEGDVVIIAPWKDKTKQCEEDGVAGEISEGPTYHPSIEQFQDPVRYIESISALAIPYGLCRIIPPEGWEVECCLSDDFSFNAEVQCINRFLDQSYMKIKMMVSRLTKSFTTISSWLTQVIGKVDGKALIEAVDKHGGFAMAQSQDNWATIGSLLGIEDVKVLCLLPDLYCHYYLESLGITVKSEEEPVCAEITEESLSKQAKESHVIGSAQLNSQVRSRTLKDFVSHAKAFESSLDSGTECASTPGEIEKMFWDLSQRNGDPVEVEMARIDTKHCGSAFPSKNDVSCSRHEWNFHVLQHNPNSILNHLGSISDVTVPILQIGMRFSSSFWSRDQHHLPSIHYLHTGDDVIWYCVRAADVGKLRTALADAYPGLFIPTNPLAFSETPTMVSPETLALRGISMSRVVHKRGQFIVVFPESVTCNISCGYNVAEILHLATPDWIPVGHRATELLHSCRSPEIFSMDHLLLQMAKSSTDLMTEDAARILLTCLDNELRLRMEMLQLGVKSFEAIPARRLNRLHRVRQMTRHIIQDEEKRCIVCSRICHISMLVDENHDLVFCLKHGIQYLKEHQRASFCKLLYRFDEKTLTGMTMKLRARLEDDGCKRKEAIGADIKRQQKVTKKLKYCSK